jgi:hypothetical protein
MALFALNATAFASVNWNSSRSCCPPAAALSSVDADGTAVDGLY